jgi:Cft2 family RNA processing exonuclease
MSGATLDVAKSHLNWMNFKGGLQDIDDNPFTFKHIKAINSLDELKRETEDRKPRVIVTSSASLELGFGRKRLGAFVTKSTNMIIFTE